MKEVVITSKVVGREGAGVPAKIGQGSTVDLSAYLLKTIWDKVWEIRTDSTGKEYIFGKLPVVTQYGITMYAGDGGDIDLPSLYAGLPIDNTTIYWDNGVLKAVGSSGGGGVADSVAWANVYGKPSWITDTKPVYAYSEITGTPDLSKYALKTDIPSLSGYATESWVLNKGYALGTELDALAVIVGKKADKSYVDDNFVTLATDQTISGLKNFSNGLELGGISVYKSQDGVVYIEGNLVVQGGITMYGTDSTDVPSIIDSLPTASTSSKGIAYFDSNYFSVSSDGKVSFIGATGGLDVTELQNYLTQNSYLNVTEGDGRYLKLSGGVMAGDIELGLNPNSTTSTTYAILFKSTNNNKYLYAKADDLYYGVDGNTTGKVLTSLNIGSHNAGSATKLQTARTIWGQSFDGTGNIDGRLVINQSTIGANHTNSPLSVTATYSSNTYCRPFSALYPKLAIGGEPNIYIGVDDSRYNGGYFGFIYNGADSSLNLVSIGIYGVDNILVANGLGNVGIGTLQPSYKLDVVGSSRFSYTGSATNSVYGGIYVSQSDDTFGESSIQFDYGNSTFASIGYSKSVNGAFLYDVTQKARFVISSNDGLPYLHISSNKYRVWTSKDFNFADYLPLTGGTLTGSLIIKNTSQSTDGLDIWVNSYQVANLTLSNTSTDKWQISARYRDDANGILNTYYYNGTKYNPIITIRNTGCFGIGKETPEYKLHIATTQNSPIYIEQSLSNNWAHCFDAYNSSLAAGQHLTVNFGYQQAKYDAAWIGYYHVGVGSTSNRLSLGLHSVDDVLNITASANVGIGTTSPSYKLHVVGSTYLNGNVYVDTLNTYSIIPRASVTYDLGSSSSKWRDVYTESVIASYVHGGGSALYLGNSGNTSYIYIREDMKASSESWSLTTAGVFKCTTELSVLHDGTNLPNINLINSSNVGHHISYRINETNKPLRFYFRNGSTYTSLMEINSSSNLLVYGGITMYSDKRKKTILRDVELSLKEVANAPLIEHYYNSDDKKTTHVGSIAQYWAEMNDWFCKLDSEGYYTMEIQNAALASAISVARELDRYETKTDKQIKKLKKRICELEEEVERLKAS